MALRDDGDAKDDGSIPFIAVLSQYSPSLLGLSLSAIIICVAAAVVGIIVVVVRIEVVGRSILGGNSFNTQFRKSS